ncbi:inositol monophosphatase family protein, partial [Stutzerimonas kunmingensis]|uniref:inositol monophosphatase family protein n=1 Tax=Stutzerimonas kunmingensis TaxID=1211807 RepID=UPI0026F1A614
MTGAEYCWVVDPNDGTRDFLRGFRGTALSVGLLRGAEPVLGVVHAPVTNGRGPDCIAWCEGLAGISRNGQILKSSISTLQLGADCSGLLIPDTDLGENPRHQEVFDEQATTYVFRRVQTRGCC